MYDYLEQMVLYWYWYAKCVTVDMLIVWVCIYTLWLLQFGLEYIRITS